MRSRKRRRSFVQQLVVSPSRVLQAVNIDMSCGVWLTSPCSRRCGNGHGLIRKYHMMLCRRCFGDYAEAIGFKKVRAFERQRTSRIRCFACAGAPKLLSRRFHTNRVS